MFCLTGVKSVICVLSGSGTLIQNFLEYKSTHINGVSW